MQQRAFGRLRRPHDAGEREMGMEAVFGRHASRAQGVAEVCLCADQPWQIGAGDAGPQHARAPNIRKGANPLHGEAKALMPADDRGQHARPSLDMSAWMVAEEMERQMDPFEGIDPDNVVQRLERADRPGQRRAYVIGNLDREKDAPAFSVIRWHGCRP